MIRISRDIPKFLDYPHIFSGGIIAVIAFINTANNEWSISILEASYYLIFWIVFSLITSELLFGLYEQVYMTDESIVIINDKEKIHLSYKDIKDIRFSYKINHVPRCIIKCKNKNILKFLPIYFHVTDMPENFQLLYKKVKTRNYSY